MNTVTDDEAGIEAAARQWVIYLHSGTVDSEHLNKFEAWVNADLKHAQAYRDCEQLMGDLTLVDELANINLEEPPPVRALPHRSPVFSKARLAAVTAIAAALVVALLVTLKLEPSPQISATELAQVRDVSLPDGSVVTLGGRSKIETVYSKHLRQITLLKGEAFFDVKVNPERPFHVLVGDRLIRVVGTQFDVRHDLERVSVAVLEGVVEMVQEAPKVNKPTAPQQVLHAGDQVVAQIGEAQQVRTRINPDDTGAWRRGRLIYTNATLEEIVAGLNRYTKRQIVLGSESLRQRRFSNSFETNEAYIKQYFYGLTDYLPIQIDDSHSDRIVLRNKQY